MIQDDTKRYKKMTPEEDLIQRYQYLLKQGIPNPYYNSKYEWILDVNKKIEELVGIMNKKQ